MRTRDRRAGSEVRWLQPSRREDLTRAGALVPDLLFVLLTLALTGLVTLVLRGVERL